jgi:hypothetical protein
VDAFAADFSTEFSLRDLGEVRCDFGGDLGEVRCVSGLCLKSLGRVWSVDLRRIFGPVGVTGGAR